MAAPAPLPLASAPSRNEATYRALRPGQEHLLGGDYDKKKRNGAQPDLHSFKQADKTFITGVTEAEVRGISVYSSSRHFKKHFPLKKGNRHFVSTRGAILDQGFQLLVADADRPYHLLMSLRDTTLKPDVDRMLASDELDDFPPHQDEERSTYVVALMRQWDGASDHYASSSLFHYAERYHTLRGSEELRRIKHAMPLQDRGIVADAFRAHAKEMDAQDGELAVLLRMEAQGLFELAIWELLRQRPQHVALSFSAFSDALLEYGDDDDDGACLDVHDVIVATKLLKREPDVPLDVFLQGIAGQDGKSPRSRSLQAAARCNMLDSKDAAALHATSRQLQRLRM
jgi:hypothetical protein